MPFDGISRRSFSVGVGAVVAGAELMAVPGAGADTGPTGAAEGISRSHAGIHQEITFAAEPARIYQTLISADLFDHVVQMSAAMSSMMSSAQKSVSCRIDARPGGAFALFGGYITGYNLELTPNTRIVQAWRVGSWPDGDFSIAKFVLAGKGAGAVLSFDHTGFPDEAAEHLAKGWYANYWNPLAKVLRGT
jgi:activator of HSP90 ATPase